MLRGLLLLTGAATLTGGGGWASGLFDDPPGPPPAVEPLVFGEVARTVRVDVGSPGPVEVTFPFENASGRPIRLSGANVSCGCVLAGDLPRTVLPGRSELTLTVDPAKYAPGEPRTVWADLYTDASSPAPRLSLTVEPFGVAVAPTLTPSPDPLFGSPR